MTQLRKTNKLVIRYANGRPYNFHRVDNVVVNGNYSVNFTTNGKQVVLKLQKIDSISFYPEGSAPDHHIQFNEGRLQFERKSFKGDTRLSSGMAVWDKSRDLRGKFELPVVSKISDI